jgi:hypothetical protein
MEQRIVVILVNILLVSALRPRRLLSSNIFTEPLYYDGNTELHVKFADEHTIRSAADFGSVVGREATIINSILKQHDITTVKALISSPRGRAAAQNMMARAANRSGTQQPDLLAVFRCEFGHAPNSTALLRAASILDSLPSVEYVHLSPKFVPPPVLSEAGILMQCESKSAHSRRRTTPLFEQQQTYRGPDPGFEADFANDLGANGKGVRLSDCEYSWDYDHEDVYPLHAEPGWTADPALFPDHGTASVGVSKGVLNGFGITGVACEAEVYTYAESTLEQGYNRVRAVTAAMAESSVGDVVLLEVSTLRVQKLSEIRTAADFCLPLSTLPSFLPDAIQMLRKSGVFAGGNRPERLDGDEDCH